MTAFPGGGEPVNSHPNPKTPLEELTDEIVACRLCPRLVEHRERIGETKRASYAEWDYWARPVPSFGDPTAPLMVLGLAPAAHGEIVPDGCSQETRRRPFLSRQCMPQDWPINPSRTTALMVWNIRVHTFALPFAVFRPGTVLRPRNSVHACHTWYGRCNSCPT